VPTQERKRTCPWLCYPGSLGLAGGGSHSDTWIGLHRLLDHGSQLGGEAIQVDLRHHGPPALRRWLRGAAKMRIIGSAYHPANDANYAITVDPWHAAFDTILHLDEVTPSRLLTDSG
jgi:hypothetical protein